jgi:hypothetical protein
MTEKLTWKSRVKERTKPNHEAAAPATRSSAESRREEAGAAGKYEVMQEL